MKNGQMKDGVEMHTDNAWWKRAKLGVVVLAVLLGSQAQGQFGGLGGFGGMSGVGSQDSTAAGTQSPRLSFRPWISATGSYAEIPEGTTASGARSTTAYGGSAGVSGGRSWQRTSVGGFFTTAYQKWRRAGFSGGLSTAGAVSVSHQVNTRTTVFATEFAGSSLGGFGYGAASESWGGNGLAGTSVFFDITGGGLGGMTNPAENGLVDNEVFAGRIHYTGTSGGLTYQPSLRWSYSVQGTGAFVRRKNPTLSDLNSYGVGGAAAYRVNQTSQVTLMYSLGTFTYPNRFGGNRVHQVMASYAVTLTPNVHAAVMGGAYLFNSTYIGQTQFDPSLAALLGQGSVLDLQKMTTKGWVGGALLNRTFRGWSAGVRVNRAVSPGNGVMLASERDSVSGSLSTSVGRFSFGTYGAYYRMNGIQQKGASADSYSVGANVGIRIAEGLHFGLNGSYRNFDTPFTTRRWTRYAAASLSYSPGDAMFRF